MSRSVLIQLQTQSVGEALQQVMQSTILIVLLAGSLVLIVLLLRFAVQLDAFPPSRNSSRKPSQPKDDGQLDGQLSNTASAQVSLDAQNYQSVGVKWSVAESLATTLRQDSQNRLMIRLLDATHIDLSTQLPHAIYDYPCDWGRDGATQVMGIAVAVGDRDYIAELGYVSADGQWHQLARSSHVRVVATAGT